MKTGSRQRSHPFPSRFQSCSPGSVSKDPLIRFGTLLGSIQIPFSTPLGPCWSLLGAFFPQHMLRASFSPGRNRACRHCWISTFWTPSGKRLLQTMPETIFKKNALQTTPDNNFETSRFLGFGSKVRCGGVLMVFFKLQETCN